jgi:hypothetical protein
MSTIQASTYANALMNYQSSSSGKNDFTKVEIDSSMSDSWTKATSALSEKDRAELLANAISENSNSVTKESITEALSKYQKLASSTSGVEQTKYSTFVDALSSFSALTTQSASSSTNIENNALYSAAQMYDVSNMTTNQMHAMANSLFKAGEIDLDTLGLLTLMPAEPFSDAEGNFMGFRPIQNDTEKFDYLQSIKNTIDFAKNTGNTNGIEYFEKTYEFLQKMDSLHQAGGKLSMKA